MKILTWNINGIRAAKIPLKELFTSLDADIICLQETKTTRDQLDEPSAIVDGYNSYFSFSKVRSGYSGVATFVKDSCTPQKAEEGLTGLLSSGFHGNIECYGNQSDFSDEELHALDNEGRTIITQHRIMDSDGHEHILTVINVYCPRADPEKDDRKTFKINFYRLLQIRAEAILKSGSHVIILGDVNTCHKKIDHCDPDEYKDFDGHPGRKWLNQFLWNPKDPDAIEVDSGNTDPDSSFSSLDTGHKFIDSFRMFHPTQPSAYTCWSTVTGARATNYGTRIDYIFGDVDLVQKAFTDCVIQPEVQGSDHCPVKATLDWEIIQAKKCPPSCTKYLPEFTGKQQKLSSFFTKKPKVSESVVHKERAVKDCPSGNDIKNNNGSDHDSGICASSSQESAISDSTPASEPPAVNSTSTKRKIIESPQSTKTNVKKLKKDDKSQNAGKQGNLLSFFSKPVVKQTQVVTKDSKCENKVSSNSSQSNTDNNQTPNPRSNPENAEIKSSQCEKTQQKATTTSGSRGTAVQSNVWKQLLKGPPSAPLCKGHKEPCLLRTVKKDSLNKGRQFWVCPRPEGHKTNPEARCEHFEWIVKKKS